MADHPHRFKMTVLGRYPARLKGNEPSVTFNVLAGTGGHLTYAGTLTMTEDEWETFLSSLTETLGDALEVDDHSHR